MSDRPILPTAREVAETTHAAVVDWSHNRFREIPCAHCATIERALTDYAAAREAETWEAAAALCDAVERQHAPSSGASQYSEGARDTADVLGQQMRERAKGDLDAR